MVQCCNIIRLFKADFDMLGLSLYVIIDSQPV